VNILYFLQLLLHFSRFFPPKSGSSGDDEEDSDNSVIDEGVRQPTTVEFVDECHVLSEDTVAEASSEHSDNTIPISFATGTTGTASSPQMTTSDPVSLSPQLSASAPLMSSHSGSDCSESIDEESSADSSELSPPVSAPVGRPAKKRSRGGARGGGRRSSIIHSDESGSPPQRRRVRTRGGNNAQGRAGLAGVRVRGGRAGVRVRGGRAGARVRGGRAGAVIRVVLMMILKMTTM